MNILEYSPYFFIFLYFIKLLLCFHNASVWCGPQCHGSECNADTLCYTSWGDRSYQRLASLSLDFYFLKHVFILQRSPNGQNEKCDIQLHTVYQSSRVTISVLQNRSAVLIVGVLRVNRSGRVYNKMLARNNKRACGGRVPVCVFLKYFFNFLLSSVAPQPLVGLGPV